MATAQSGSQHTLPSVRCHTGIPSVDRRPQILPIAAIVIFHQKHYVPTAT